MRKWLPLTAVCLGTFMLLIDVTIVNVALPAMAVDLSTSFSSLQWVIDIYALVLAALLLGAGSVSDIVGRRRIYLIGLVVFAIASLASGLSPNGATLIIARGVQGVGAAAMFATTITLLNVAYTGRDRGVAYGVWGAVSGAAAALGPTLGGVLTEEASWRWIFFVNLPISAVAIALSIMVLDPARGTHKARLDVPGLIAFTAASSLLTYAFIRAGDDGWVSASTISLIVAGVVVGAAFVLIERRTAAPLLDVGLFTERRFVGVMIAALALSLTAFSNLAYTSIWLQSVLDLPPIEAGLVYLPLSLAAFVVSAAIGRRLHNTEPRWIISIGLFLIGVGGLAQAVLGSGSRWPALVAGLLLIGIGVGLVNPTMAAATMASVPLHRGGMAAGAMNTARQLGLAFGIAVLGSVFQSRIAHALSTRQVPNSHSVATAVSGGQSHGVLAATPAAGRSTLDAAIHSAFASGLNTIFIAAGVLGILSAVAVVILLRPVAVSVDEALVPTAG